MNSAAVRIIFASAHRSTKKITAESNSWCDTSSRAHVRVIFLRGKPKTRGVLTHNLIHCIDSPGCENAELTVGLCISEDHDLERVRDMYLFCPVVGAVNFLEFSLLEI